FGTGCGVTVAATGDKNVIGFGLLRPEDFTGIQIQRQDSIGGRLLGLGVVITDGYIQSIAPGVDTGRRPDGTAGWAEIATSIGSGSQAGCFIDWIALPEQISAIGIKCHDAAPERAAGVTG